MRDKSPDSDTLLHRRHFLKNAGVVLVGLAIFGRVLAADPKIVPPKPQNVISAEAALQRLIKGNARYVSGAMRSHDFHAERSALVAGQNPFAAVLSCADSRVAPEYAFDTGRGDLFVCRVAGNFSDPESIASLEYGVAFLNIPLILVLGHQSCGAVGAAVTAVKDGATFPGHIPYLIKALRPAVQAAEKDPGTSLLDAAIKQNVLLNVEKLKTVTPILSKAVTEKKLKVVGGVYDLKTGKVEFLD